MKVEFLRGLGLDDEVINKIQAESGKDVTEAKNKSQATIDSLNEQITSLTGQVSQRDSDLAELRTQLESAGQSATKLSELQKNMQTLQDKYDTETQEYKTKLENQKYEFIVREAMNGIKFSCNAAKKEFLANLMSDRLPEKDGKLLGFEEYVAKQKEADPQAFITEQTPAPPVDQPPLPNFAPPAPPQKNPPPAGENEFGFNFLAVRKHD